MPIEVIGAAKPIETNPEFIPGTACRDGNCAPKKNGAACDEQSKADRWHKLGRWLTYRPTSVQGCSIYPTPYRPSVYAYFPPNPNACRSVTGAACLQTSAVGPMITAAPMITAVPVIPAMQMIPAAPVIPAVAPKPAEAALPKLELPNIVQQQRPFIPGSSSVLAPEPASRYGASKPTGSINVVVPVRYVPNYEK